MADNETLKTIRDRRSVARFAPDPVSEEHVEAILEAGRWAPSRHNSQPWDFVVVTDPEVRGRMADVLQRTTVAWRGFSEAPVSIVVSVDPRRDPRHFVEAGAVAAQNMALAAQSLGLSTFWAGVYTRRRRRGSMERDLARILSLPEKHRIVAVLPVGFAGHEAHSTRRHLWEMVHRERY